MSSEKTWADGSFEKYLHHSGDFVTTVAIAIQRADPVNRERLRRAFPQMVAAFEHHDWCQAPPGFEPHYQADMPLCEICGCRVPDPVRPPRTGCHHSVSYRPEDPHQ